MLPIKRIRSGSTTLGVFNMQCGIVGGDWFDHCYNAILRESVIAIADVMGHGGLAARYANFLAKHFDKYREGRRSPFPLVKFVEEMNTEMFGLGGKMWSSLQIIRIVDHSDTIQVVNAGHVPPLHLHRDGSAEFLRQASSPLGANAQIDVQITEHPFEASSSLLIYTDGIVEQPSPAGQKYGNRKLRDFMATQREESPVILVGNLYQSLRTHTDGQPFNDDVTLVAIARA